MGRDGEVRAFTRHHTEARGGSPGAARARSSGEMWACGCACFAFVRSAGGAQRWARRKRSNRARPPLSLGLRSCSSAVKGKGGGGALIRRRQKKRGPPITMVTSPARTNKKLTRTYTTNICDTPKMIQKSSASANVSDASAKRKSSGLSGFLSTISRSSSTCVWRRLLRLSFWGGWEGSHSFLHVTHGHV